MPAPPSLSAPERPPCVRRVALFLMAAVLTACVSSTVVPRSTNAGAPPSAVFANVPERPSSTEFTETVFGHNVADPFRWMEDSARSAEMAAWVRKASEHARAQLAALPGRARLAAALDSASRSGVAYDAVQIANGNVFALRLDPDASLSKLVVRNADDAKAVERLLVDPGAGQTKQGAINNYSASPTGRIVAVHTAAGGGEVGAIRFLEVESGRWLDDVLDPVWGEFPVSWIGDTLVFFTRMASPSRGDPLEHMTVRLHQLGRPLSNQRVLLSAEAAERARIAPQEFPSAVERPLSDWTLAYVGGARADIRLLVATDADARAGRAAWRDVAGYDDRVSAADVRGTDIFFVTTKSAPNGELRRTDVRTGTASNSSLVLPAGQQVLQNIVLTADGVYIVTLEDGVNRLLFLPDGRPPARRVALDAGTIADARESGDGRRLTLAIITWTRASRYFTVDGGVARSLGLESTSYAGAGAIEAVQDEAVSKDGTRVPMTILRRRGATLSVAPTLLNAYGSYGITTTQYHSRMLSVWVERGGIYAHCGVRGGGEKGRAWHEAGRAANKPNAHADLIACAERLIALGYTTPAKLAVTGTSAGGLLAPPVALKRPDLFRVVVPRVAVLNPTRLGVAQNGSNQFAEMGDPNTADGFSGLAAQDAYLMLDQAQDSPDWFLTVGLNDRRVEPWMSAKFAAKALAKFGGRRLVWVRADTEAGHGVGSTRDQTIAEWADIYSFLLNRFGDPAFQPLPDR